MTIRGITLSKEGLYISPKWLGGIAMVVAAIIIIMVMRTVSPTTPQVVVMPAGQAVSAGSQQVPVAQLSGRPANQVRVQDVLLTVQSVHSTWDGLPAPEPWLKYVVIEASMKNVSANNVPGGPDDGFLLDSDGVKNKVWGAADTNFNRWQPTTPRAGQESTGIFVFKIPKESTPVALQFTEERGPGGTIPIR